MAHPLTPFTHHPPGYPGPDPAPQPAAPRSHGTFPPAVTCPQSLPRGITYPHRLSKRRTFSSENAAQYHSPAPTEANTRFLEERSDVSPRAHVSNSPPHGSSAAFCWQLWVWSDFLLKGFFSCLSFNGGLKQSSSMAKEEGEG